MTTQTVNLKLPEEIYQRLQRMAAATHRPLEEVIFQTIRGNLPPALDDLRPDLRDLVADLQQMGDETLWTVAREPLSAQNWHRHQRLLRKAQSQALTTDEQAELSHLRDDTDRRVVRRSYALALLKWRGYTLPAEL